MERHVARVGTWNARVRAPDGALATIGRDVLERATREALASVAARRPREVVALRSVRVDLRATRASGAWSLAASDLRRAIERTLAERTEAARERALAHHLRAFEDDDLAWYASAGIHLAHAIAHDAEPRPWPVARWSRESALAELLESDRDDRADALAELAAIWAPRSMRGDLRAAVVTLADRLESLGGVGLSRLASPWLASRDDRIALIDALPPQLLEVIAAREILARGGSDAAVVALVAMSFDVRPGVRDARPAARTLPRALDPGALRSRAAGLILWNEWLEEWGLAGAIRDAYPDARAAKLARWALARALEDVTMDDGDPLALLFAGEEPGHPTAARAELRAIDPEPLHRAAVAWWASRRPVVVDVAPWAWGALALADDVVLDAHEGAPEQARAELVARLTARGAPPFEVSLVPELGARAGAVFEIDAASFAEPWRRAARAAASAARAELRRTSAIELRDLRGMDASVDPGRASVRVDDAGSTIWRAAWPARTSLGGRAFEIVLAR